MNRQILAEELLILLAYGLDLLTRPTFRNWDQSYEGWLSRNGLLKRAQYLEAQKFLAREGKRTEWVYRLTDQGRLRACGGRDPVARWARPWDGWWRLFVFDLPVSQQRVRLALLRWLRRNGFGYLQDSVWISPDPVEKLAEATKGFRDDAELFTVLECRCAPGFSDNSLVRGAWRFAELNKRYETYRELAAGAVRKLRNEPLHPRDLFTLIRSERTAWIHAFEEAPLLPRRLWPKDYGGERAWKMRTRLLGLLKGHVAPG